MKNVVRTLLSVLLVLVSGSVALAQGEYLEAKESGFGVGMSRLTSSGGSGFGWSAGLSVHGWLDFGYAQIDPEGLGDGNMLYVSFYPVKQGRYGSRLSAGVSVASGEYAYPGGASPDYTSVGVFVMKRIPLPETWFAVCRAEVASVSGSYIASGLGLSGGVSLGTRFHPFIFAINGSAAKLKYQDATFGIGASLVVSFGNLFRPVPER